MERSRQSWTTQPQLLRVMEKALDVAAEGAAVVVNVDGEEEAGDAVVVAVRLRRILPSIP